MKAWNPSPKIVRHDTNGDTPMTVIETSQLKELRDGFSDLRSSVVAALIFLPIDCNGKQLLEEALPKANSILNVMPPVERTVEE
jgi:hypothetical protein